MSQIHLTLEARQAEYELDPLALDQDCGILVWSLLAGGLLWGKHRRDKDVTEERHVEGWDEPPVRDPDKLYDIIEVLVEIAEGRDVSAQVALAWLLGRPGVTSVVVGAHTNSSPTTP